MIRGALAYYRLIKPGIIFGNSIPMIAGFFLASHGQMHLEQFISTFWGLFLVIASACVCNNCIDKVADQKMKRTANRPIAMGLIEEKHALIFAMGIGALGFFLLAFYVNLLATLMAFIGFVMYVFIYSFFKYQSHHATLVGSVAGAMPPLVGYAAVNGRLDFTSFILFAMMVSWQMPHFFAIAIYRMDEYAKAFVPILPLVKGIKATKWQMLLYTIAFALISCLLPLIHDVEAGYLMISSLLGIGWIVLGILGFRSQNELLWARQMFIFSLVAMTILFLAIPFCIHT